MNAKANKLMELNLKLRGLAVFASLKENEVLENLWMILDELMEPCCEEFEEEMPVTGELVNCYGDLLAALYPQSADLSEYIKKLVLQDDNYYVKAVASGKEIAPEIEAAVARDLETLQALADLTSEELMEAASIPDYLPKWSNSDVDLKAEFAKKLATLNQTGYGEFAKYNFFRLKDDELVAVKHPSFQPLDQFFEYQRERDLIIKNTEALVNGTGASNMLLYGDAGTGKSSTIKAVAAAYADKGVRLIEVTKNQLYQIPDLMETLSDNPLKFILFIDDLSFIANDDNFSALKATLEGSVSGCGDNAVIFATSNRRHLVKESMKDRDGDELYVNDSLQETMSLSARFGLTITFQKPGKDVYLTIVKELADQNGIDIPEDELITKAEAHAIRMNGRSPRTARQFIDLLKIGVK